MLVSIHLSISQRLAFTFFFFYNFPLASYDYLNVQELFNPDLLDVTHNFRMREQLQSSSSLFSLSSTWVSWLTYKSVQVLSYIAHIIQ